MRIASTADLSGRTDIAIIKETITALKGDFSRLKIAGKKSITKNKCNR